MESPPRLIDFVPDEADPYELLGAFCDWAEASDLELYPHQSEAILRLLAGDNVVLATPTGSGKSLVALAGVFAALALRKRAVYTAPVKALVSEKFFEMVAALGPENVGMATGDASVNAAAPVVVCTAEILALRALHAGSKTDVDLVVMDEFHYYGDKDRGWAWQVPLLELNRVQFLLMSATLGDTTRLRHDLTRRNGRASVLVASAERPVPLDMKYCETPLHATIAELLGADKAPVYIVHFTQREATAQAQSLTSLNVLKSTDKTAIKQAVNGFQFDTPFGKDLRRFVLAGVGVHHAGLLPKYRRLVEKLAQLGHLKLICGTDTLGVGVNVPIRTVLFTRLYKFDGHHTRILSVRDFQQIAGRAGRRGFDEAGSVWVQAPEHVINNRRAEAQAASNPAKRRKVVKKKPPEQNYAHYDSDTLTRLWHGQPKTLDSSFAVTHSIMLNVLDRPGDGCDAMKRLLIDNHEPRLRQRKHIRKAVRIFRSLVDAEIVEVLEKPDSQGRPLRVNLDLQDEFRLNQPLSLFAVEALDALDVEDPTYHWQVLSVVEAVLEDPIVVLLAQRDKARDDLMAQLKAEGIVYEERLERLAALSWPQPEAEYIQPAFAVFARYHPWVNYERPSPKSVARDLLELGDTFNQYVSRYGIKRSEGALLRYLSDCYKALVQTVPSGAVNKELAALTSNLHKLVASVDASLIDEWEHLRGMPKL
ncbi:MAG: DUF3516 domain-containing protein [Acidimicrobiia bacterium]|nr:DUF3516 domain-containing protein [Acidimicrobiia bacterium]MYC57071.1 DUF3516 domain-containing protein [Acidimicrobiia bacterium]MYI30148.1 DUF3516 domain-containing protein [Acidimicrobiia bacterium]